MIDAIDEIKVRARLLHKRVEAGDEQALARLRRAPRFMRSKQAADPGDSEVRHKDCLEVVAREVGFQSFAHAQRVLTGDAHETDYGKLLHGPGCAPYLNHWFTRYDEAHETHAQIGGYLLAYQRHFVIVPAGYIEALGLDPEDPDWRELHWDWVSPEGTAARVRLYKKRMAALPRELE